MYSPTHNNAGIFLCWTAILILVFVLAVLSKRKTDFEIRPKSNLPSKQTRENYRVTQ